MDLSGRIDWILIAACCASIIMAALYFYYMYRDPE